MKSYRKVTAGALSLATAVALVAGCTSAKSGGTGSSNGAGQQASPGTSGSAVNQPTGSEVSLMVIAPKNNAALSAPQILKAAQARVDQINASGGLNGHKLKLVQCDMNMDPNQEKACLDQAVSDKVSAVVGSFMLFDPLDELKAANIPLLGAYGLTKSQFTSPISYPLGGEVSWFLGMVAMAKQDGVKTAAIASLSQGAAATSDAITTGGMNKAGIENVGVVRTSLTAVDYSAPAAQLTKKNPDAIFLNETPQTIVGIVTAIRQTGYTGKLYTVSGSLSPSAIKSMGSAAEGLRIASLASPITDTANPQVAAFLADMQKYAPGTAQDEFAQLGWSGVYLYAAIMKDATSFSGTDVISRLSKLTTPVPAGVFGGFVGTGQQAGLSEYPRAINTEFAPEVVKNGNVESLGDFRTATQGTT